MGKSTACPRRGGAPNKGEAILTEEIRQLLATCMVHQNMVAKFLELGQPAKAEFRSRELAENAKLLSNALYRIQRTSGEVTKT